MTKSISFKIRGYTIGWGEQQPDYYMLALNQPDQDSFVIEGLTAGRSYKVTVRAYNDVGDSPAALIEVKTKPLPDQGKT